MSNKFSNYKIYSALAGDAYLNYKEQNKIFKKQKECFLWILNKNIEFVEISDLYWFFRWFLYLVIWLAL